MFTLPPQIALVHKRSTTLFLNLNSIFKKEKKNSPQKKEWVVNTIIARQWQNDIRIEIFKQWLFRAFLRLFNDGKLIFQFFQGTIWPLKNCKFMIRLIFLLNYNSIIIYFIFFSLYIFFLMNSSCIILQTWIYSFFYYRRLGCPILTKFDEIKRTLNL